MYGIMYILYLSFAYITLITQTLSYFLCEKILAIPTIRQRAFDAYQYIRRLRTKFRYLITLKT